PFTVFAPSNTAFLRSHVSLTSLKSDPAALAQLLKLHVVSGKLMLNDLKVNEKTLTALSGETIRVNYYMYYNRVTVDGAYINSPNHVASNGVVHMIDHLMLPPNGKGPFTLFAPTNAAFNSLAILLYHVIHGTLYTRGMHSGSLNTLEAVDREHLLASSSSVSTAEVQRRGYRFPALPGRPLPLSMRSTIQMKSLEIIVHLQSVWTDGRLQVASLAPNQSVALPEVLLGRMWTPDVYLEPEWNSAGVDEKRGVRMFASGVMGESRSIKSPERNLEELTYFRGHPSSCLEVQFHITRKFKSILFRVYLPSFLAVMMAWASFWIHRDEASARIKLGTLVSWVVVTEYMSIEYAFPRYLDYPAGNVWMIGCVVFTWLSFILYVAIHVVRRKEKTAARHEDEREKAKDKYHKRTGERLQSVSSLH
ncbi:GLRA1-like protein, partial [Mya arenaria]